MKSNPPNVNMGKLQENLRAATRELRLARKAYEKADNILEEARSRMNATRDLFTRASRAIQQNPEG